MKRFKRIYVEITNACNLSCSICPGTSRKTSFISPESFESILGKIGKFTDYLYLHVMGEPLLHQKFPELLDICDMHSFKVNIATNGVLIGRHREALLKSKAVRQVNFSIHCLEIQRNSELPETYLADILKFIDDGRRNTGIYFALRLWNMKPGAAADTEMLERLGDFFGLAGKIENMDVKGKGIKLAPNVFLNFGEEFSWPGMDPEPFPDGKAFCRGMRDQCAILVDGTVVPCCLDRDGVISLGNIFKDEFSEIIRCGRSEKIILGFSEGRAVEALCKNCGFRRRFSS